MQQPAAPSAAPRTPLLVLVVAWVLVGVPLLWGILITFRKAALLFK